jgi:hypothetical protein
MGACDEAGQAKRTGAGAALRPDAVRRHGRGAAGLSGSLNGPGSAVEERGRPNAVMAASAGEADVSRHGDPDSTVGWVAGTALSALPDVASCCAGDSLGAHRLCGAVVQGSACGDLKGCISELSAGMAPVAASGRDVDVWLAGRTPGSLRTAGRTARRDQPDGIALGRGGVEPAPAVAVRADGSGYHGC